jgi:tetratricopeptide (TPR) repeat protein
MLRSAGLICALAISTDAFAQAVDESALEALDRQTPISASLTSEPSGAVELRAAMRRISFNSSDADALADAGNAALALGDANAGLNFFTRANALRPGNSRIVSGLAIATVRTENPFEALRLFDNAVKLGAIERSIAVDRALAFDLLGNFGRAQQDYKLARTAATSDELIIRQAVSLSLAGQKDESDAMLVPLLQKNDAAAWRARAFMLAARGELRESTKVAQGFMDAASAQRMERFFRLMPNLTGAQQAAAIHLGHFPTGQSVGRDSEQVRRVAAAIPQSPIAPSESRLIPSGTPLGPKTASAATSKVALKPDRRRDRKALERAEVQAAIANIPDALKLPKADTSRLGTAGARAKVQEAQSSRIASVSSNALPVPETARPLVSAAIRPPANTPTPLPTIAPALARSAPVVTPIAPAMVVPARVVPVAVQPASPAVGSVSSPNLQSSASEVVALNVPQVTISPTSSTATLSATPSVPVQIAMQTAATPPVASSGFDLGAIVGAIKIPESEQRPSQIPVDLKKLKPATPKAVAAAEPVKVTKVDPKIAAKAKAEKDHPARFWVQIAAGNADALGFDYRKFAKKSPELFKGRNPFTSEWGKTDRLLVGPFADMKAAKKWETDYKKTGADSFSWKSEIGAAVNPLKVK